MNTVFWRIVDIALGDPLGFYVDKLDVPHPKLTDQMASYIHNAAQRLALQCLNLTLNVR